ncbi:MAG: pyruvate formate lyase-activating protein [Lactobacillales bacterium]|jgi:pyruvate formate lyase activating enzyme|nr:pyruvate formate lyase-activating protein [Lactobacillales bacterium]
MNKVKVGFVHSTENFGTVDGPGVRFVIFMQGCSMRCKFCHNPDTWSLKTQKMRKVNAEEILEEAKCFRNYWGCEGGITVSGGEPLLQLDFLLDLFAKAKKQGINTVLDTCGQPFTRQEPFFSKLNQILAFTDLILYDIKEINNNRHKALTAHANENILEFAKYLSDIKQPLWIRHVLVSTMTDFNEDLKALDEFIQTLKNVQKVEVLPYHKMGEFKWRKLELKCPLEGIKPPTKMRIENARKLLHVNNYQQVLRKEKNYEENF